MLAIRGLFYLALFLGSIFAARIEQQAVGPIAPNSPAINTQEEYGLFSGEPITQGTVAPIRLNPDEFGSSFEPDHSATQLHQRPVSPPVASKFDSVKSNYTLGNGLGYYKLVKGNYLNWESARDDCLADGAHLAVINSQYEARGISDIYYSMGIKTDIVFRTVWVGAYRPQGQQQYITVHGTPLERTGFNHWTGTDETGERCVQLDVKELALVSTSCGSSAHHICEHPL